MKSSKPVPSTIIAAQSNKKQVSIIELLYWAFQRECANVNFDDYHPSGARVSNYDTIYMMMRQTELGCRVDGGGRSDPHEDADMVVDALAVLPEGVGGRRMALWIAELARIGRCPDWMKDAKPTVQPREWGKPNQYGQMAKTEVLRTIPVQKRGRIVMTEIKWCPIRITPTAAQIGAARRGYLEWHAALLELSTTFQIYGGLTCHEVTGDLPHRAPWRKDVDFI